MTNRSGVNEMEWQPISSAPKDEIVLLYRPNAVAWGIVAPGKFNHQQYNKIPAPYWEIWLKIGGTNEGRLWEPTHWMPLPNPPAKQE